MKVPILAALAPVVLLASVVSVAAAELSPEDVQKAMSKGVAYLKDRWQTEKGWSEYAGQEGGIKCLCTMALLNAGESPDEQVYLKNALEGVRKLHPTTTYVVALQTMVLCRADQLERDQDIIAHNVELLQEWQIKAGVADRKGGWSYGENTTGPRGSIQGDGSNSQFALLALYEAARAAEKHHLHIKIDRETWERARNYWITNQNGGWGYYKTMEPTGSMTCAGISSLVICSDMLHDPDAKVTGDTIDGCVRAVFRGPGTYKPGHKLVAGSFHGGRQSAFGRRKRPPLALLLSIWPGTRRAALGTAQDRRARLVSPGSIASRAYRQCRPL